MHAFLGACVYAYVRVYTHIYQDWTQIDPRGLWIHIVWVVLEKMAILAMIIVIIAVNTYIGRLS